MTSRAAIESLVPEEIEGASYPNVRAADNPSIHDEILGGRDRDKFLAFLSSGEIDAWARPMFGTSDYVKIPSNAWDTHRIKAPRSSSSAVGNLGLAICFQNIWVLRIREFSHGPVEAHSLLRIACPLPHAAKDGAYGYGMECIVCGAST